VDVQVYQPAPVLRPFFKSYFTIVGQVPASHTTPVLPCTYSVMQFNFAEPVRLDGPANGSGMLPPLMVCGQTARPFAMHFAGEVATLGVMVEPATYRLLFGAAMGDLVDHVHDAAALLGSARARGLYADMERYRTRPAELVAAFERFWYRALSAKLRVPAGVAGALAAIRAGGGQEPVGALAHRLGTGRRTLERRFAEHVGLSPKGWSRLVRFNGVLGALAGRPALAQAALESGYYDQAHFQHEFRALAGLTPRQFLLAMQAREPHPLDALAGALL